MGWRGHPPQRLLFLIPPILLLSLLPSLHADAPTPTPTPPALSLRKIALLHLHDGAPFFSRLGALTLANKKRYAGKHGYEVIAHTPDETSGLWKRTTCDTPHAQKRANDCYVQDQSFRIDARAPTFGKVKLALAACVGREGYWMLWSDADAMLINHTIAMEDIIDDRFHMQTSVDWLMMNAGVILMKCTKWTISFLERLYNAREFDSARALDQSAFQHFFDTQPETKTHMKYVAKHKINVYVEEYRPGDFILHLAGKLYEATTKGATALAHQFDILSYVDDIEDVRAFFRSQYLLNAYSGICIHDGGDARDSECASEDKRRKKLKEPLGYMSWPNRYRHVGMRYYWLGDWKDTYDVEEVDRVVFDGRREWTEELDELEEGGREVDVEEGTHDEL